MKHVLLASALGAVACAGCGGGSGGGGPPPVTHLFFGQDTNTNGLFEINTATGAATLVGAGATGMANATNGLTETPNPFLLIGSVYSPLVNISSDGSGASVITGSVGAEGLAMNIKTGTLYAIINTAYSTVNPVTGLQITALATAPFDIEGIAGDPSTGLIYGIVRLASTDLYVYDPGSNAWSVVGSTGVTWTSPGLAFDHTTGVLYAVESATDSLYRINPSTGATVLVGALGTNGGGGLAFVED